MKRLVALALIAAAVPALLPAQTPAPAPKAVRQFEFIDAASVDPDRMLPAPPTRGSVEEAIEMAQLRQMIGTASPARLAAAKADGETEDPSIFSAVIGRDLKAMPATWALLRTIQKEANLAINLSKDHFARMRPYGVDPALPNCAAPGKAPTRSYPSGHAGLGYSVGYTLAQLVPAKAPAILARAKDYADSRLICGVHFPSDVEASHALGTMIAQRLLGDPRLARRIAAARAELAAN